MNLIPPEIVLWGGTGQAKVLRFIAEGAGSRIVAVFDDTPGLPPPFPDVPLLEGRSGFEKWIADKRGRRIGFAVAIGNPHGRARLRLHDLLVGAGLEPVTLVHPSAVVAPDAEIGEGCQIHPGAIVMPEARLGRHCIVNTRASVDHECVLEDAVEIGPGATLCGDVHVGTAAWVCAGATVLPRLHIGADAVVGAGALVRASVPDRATYVGVPARPINKKESTP